MTLRPSGACAALIKQAEGCARKMPDGRFASYPDPASGGAPFTIGWGSTGPNIDSETVWTQEQCNARFVCDLAEFGARVARIVGAAPTTQSQFDAMASFAYNLGAGKLAASTLLRKHRRGDHDGAAAEFARWTKALGKVMPGLVERRAAEAALYRGRK